MLCPKFNSHVYKLKMWAIGEHMGEKTCFNWAMPSSKNFDDGPFNMVPSKKKHCEHTHELIDMNHTIYIIHNNV